MIEPSTALDLIYVPQPKAEHIAIQEEPRTLEERLEGAAETLLIRPHMRGFRDGLRGQASCRGGPAPVVVIEVLNIVRQYHASMAGYRRGDLVLDVTEKGSVADRGRWGGR